MVVLRLRIIMRSNVANVTLRRMRGPWIKSMPPGINLRLSNHKVDTTQDILAYAIYMISYQDCGKNSGRFLQTPSAERGVHSFAGLLFVVSGRCRKSVNVELAARKSVRVKHVRAAPGVVESVKNMEGSARIYASQWADPPRTITGLWWLAMCSLATCGSGRFPYL